MLDKKNRTTKYCPILLLYSLVIKRYWKYRRLERSITLIKVCVFILYPVHTIHIKEEKVYKNRLPIICW